MTPTAVDHKPAWLDDVPTGRCSCGARWPCAAAGAQAMTPTAVDVLARAQGPVLYGDRHSDPCESCQHDAEQTIERLAADPDKAVVVAALLDAETLGEALIDSGLMRRYADYANSLPTMTHGTPEDLAPGWADAILAALRGQP